VELIQTFDVCLLRFGLSICRRQCTQEHFLVHTSLM